MTPPTNEAGDMFVDEEGLLFQRPINQFATFLGEPILPPGW